LLISKNGLIPEVRRTIKNTKTRNVRSATWSVQKTSD